MPALIEPSQVGKREDLWDVLTRVDSKTTPVSSMIATGDTPHNTLMDWVVDTHKDPELGGTLSMADVTEFENHADERDTLHTYLQKFRTASMIDQDAVDVSDVAGVANEYAEATKKMLIKLKRSIELTILSDQEHQAQSGGDPYLTRGIGNWLRDTANISNQVIFQVPAVYRILAGQYETTATASLGESEIQDVLQTIYDNVGMINRDHILFAGSVLRRRMTAMTRAESSGGTNTQLATRNFNYDGSSNTYRQTVTYFEGDFGNIEVYPVSYINTGGTVDTDKGYLLDMDMWCLRWKQMPDVFPLEDKGGGPRFYTQARCAVQCKNPLSNAIFIP